MTATTESNYHQLVDDAWQGMESAIVALQQINDTLYPNDGEMGAFRAPRADVALLAAKVREMTQELKSMEAAQAARNVPPSIPDFLPSLLSKS